ncbi:MAG: 16S rRNA (cytosine(1402)-N(4))-methyltransferase RsmH [Mycobacteriales bacterium]
MTASEQHVPVLLDEVRALLRPALADHSAVVVDATLGLGGHAEALLREHPGLVLIGLDRDPTALDLARERLAPYADRIHLAHVRYDALPDVLAELDLGAVDGVLFDLGVSSLQIDTAARGFAYSRDTPLDMRMDPTGGPTAADVVNGAPEPELARILREYGEERYAPRIAAAIVRERAVQPFDHSLRLAELVAATVPRGHGRPRSGHPAKRTFQALRIEVNQELVALAAALPAAIDALRVAGRIVVLSYHSLEDGIVKRALTDAATDHTPSDLPVLLPEYAPTLRMLSRGTTRAGEAEASANPRSASVRLRAAERVRTEAA